MCEVGFLGSQLDQWSSMKNEFIYVDQKLDVFKGLYDQYLDKELDDFNIQTENRNYILSLFEEYKELKREIEEEIYSSQTDERRNSAKIHKLNLEKTEALTQEIIKSEADLKKLEEDYSLTKQQNGFKKSIQEEESKNKILSIRLEKVMDNYRTFAKIDRNQSNLISHLIQSNEHNSTDTILLTKYYFHEILNGIQITNRMPYENRDMFEQLNAERPWYDIIFKNLPDSILDFDSNLDMYPDVLKQNLSYLCNSTIEFYKSIFRKRKTSVCALSKKIDNCVFLNSLDDYKLIHNNKMQLICMQYTEQEINDAMKQFAVEWVKGSRIINILLNSSSSKMATILLPQFYPLTGSNHIKLLKLYSYEDKDIQNFKIEETFATLTEWISVFTEMFNKNQIV